MTKNNKNLLKKIEKLEKLLLQQSYRFTEVNKLLKLCKSLSKRQNPKNLERIVIERWREWRKISAEMFRKRERKESRGVYKRAQKAFHLAKRPKGIDLVKFIVTNITPKFIPSSIKFVTKKRTYTKPFSVKRLRKWKVKKVYARMGSSVEVEAIKRWTNINVSSGKKFLDKLNTKRTGMFHVNNTFNYVNFFQTYRRSTAAMGIDFEKRKKKLKLNSKQKNKYKKLKALRIKLLSKVPHSALIPPGRYSKPNTNLTDKQKWLENRYLWLKRKSSRRRRFRIDFLKTVLGTQFLMAHKTSQKKARRARQYRKEFKIRSWDVLNHFSSSRHKWAKRFQGDQKRAWFYTNVVIPKRVPYYFQRNVARAEYPFNKFKEHWSTRARYPWLHSLISKRVLYSGFLTSERRELKWSQKFNWTPFLRNKRPVYEKKNKLYYQRKRLLRARSNRSSIRTKKKARIKQVLQRTTLPFYGHLRVKQFNKIKEKARKKKSTLLSREDIQLGYLERRLDVIVYRLNLAPNIFWARKLIQDGSIYVSASSKMAPTGQTKEFEKMYAHYKHNAYPLKLRDPQSLYKKTPWNNSFTKGFKIPFGKDFVVENNTLVKRESLPQDDQNYKLISTKLKFLLEPLRNINYLTSPGDVILCAPGALNNQYKSNKVLWQKPVPTHLLSYSNLTETQTKFRPRSNSLGVFARPTDKTTNIGVVLFDPTFTDLHRRDRIQRSFLRWMSL